ncbi:winged helix-turn-helix domain-containing protein, partial [Streptomyces spectabilis]|uniref:winged helix-turn-helix domain-containing protein n=1 Tax=Streptomyces spectabilis TaxID=68270 RepID=UPI003F4CDB49
MNAKRAPGSGPDLASVARLLADGTRAAFCLALLDGRAWTATELARHAGVAPSTATEHLHLLVRGLKECHPTIPQFVGCCLSVWTTWT